MKTQKTIAKKIQAFVLATLMVAGIFSCKKTEDVKVSDPLFQSGQPVSNTAPIHGSLKGTMLADNIYYVDGDVTINQGDTLVLQQGVKVYFKGNFSFIVRGSLISLGSKDKPNYFTVENMAKRDVAGQDISSDPAYQGTWGGLLGDTATDKMIIKWTHIEFGCATLATSPVYGIKNGGKAYMISFVNPNGTLVLEDSWLYGGTDDPIRIQGGKIHVMRNTFEKSGSLTGEGINIKSGTVGNVAYNVFVGPSTNGIKPSNNGGKNPQTNIYAYNNTILNGGYRRADGGSLGRGGSINFEEGSKGVAYNNLIVNCKFGLRIVGTANYLGNALVIADTANLKYGYNWNYNDSLAGANQIYPVSFLTKPQPSDIPAPTFLPTGYKLGDVFDGSSTVQKNNPMFVNYPLPQSNGLKLSSIAFVGNYNFRLQSSSPAIGKGFTGFTPLSAVPVDPTFGATEVTLPSADLGAYSKDGRGNQH